MQTKSIDQPPAELASLSELGSVQLEDFYRAMFEAAVSRCIGSAPYPKRMKVELYEFLALAQISGGRIEPLAATFEGEFQMHFILHAPVPMKNAEDEVVIFDWAHIHLRYPEEALSQALPGTAFVRILKPNRVFHPNASEPGPGIPGQVLCLGAAMPPATRLREIVMITWGALTLQSVSLDLMDPAGVLNPDAVLYWQSPVARERIPLTTEPFLNPRALAVPSELK